MAEGTHKIYRNGRFYDEVDPARFPVPKIVTDFAHDNPGNTYSARDEKGVEYFHFTAPCSPLPGASHATHPGTETEVPGQP